MQNSQGNNEKKHTTTKLIIYIIIIIIIIHFGAKLEICLEILTLVLKMILMIS